MTSQNPRKKTTYQAILFRLVVWVIAYYLFAHKHLPSKTDIGRWFLLVAAVYLLTAFFAFIGKHFAVFSIAWEILLFKTLLRNSIKKPRQIDGLAEDYLFRRRKEISNPTKAEFSTEQFFTLLFETWLRWKNKDKDLLQ